MDTRNVYFATLSGTELGDALLQKVDDYYKYLEVSGKMGLFQHAYSTYYKPGNEGGRMYAKGEKGEYVRVCVNHFRNLLQHVLSLTVSQRPAFESKASNTDYRSQCQAILSNGLLDYYLSDEDTQLEFKLKDATERSLYLGEGWVYVGWNATGGKEYGSDPETGQVTFEGNIEVETFGPLDIIRDFQKLTNSSHLWFITQRFKNKYILAAQYPEYSEQILAIADPNNVWPKRKLSNKYQEFESDDIPVYSFYHAPCSLLPTGRLVEFVSNEAILIDTALPYRNLPVYRIMCSEQNGTCFGYSNYWDLLPLQQIVDNMSSTISSNQRAFGSQNIMAPKGSGVNASDLGEGLQLIEFDPKAGPPQPLNLLQTPAELFNYRGNIIGEMETLSGIPATTRGNPEASLKSGAALALVQSLAVQFSQPLQQSYAMLIESVGTAIIKILRDFASVPRITTIVGKSDRAYMREFSGSDLDQIDRVKVDMGNPLSRTIAGKVNMAEMLVQAGLVSNPDQYIQVVSTGTLEPVIHGKQAELMLINAENEKLGDGQPVQAVLTDNHAMHIQEHKVVLASPEARENPGVVQNALMHIQEHMDMLMTTDPQLLLMLGQQPLQPPPMGMPPQEGAPEEMPPELAGALEQNDPIDNAASKVRMPSLPKPAGE